MRRRLNISPSLAAFVCLLLGIYSITTKSIIGRHGGHITGGYAVFFGWICIAYAVGYLVYRLIKSLKGKAQ